VPRASSRPPTTGARYPPGVHEIDPTDSPSLDPFEVALTAAIERLPAAYREQLATVAVVIAEEASPEELASTGAHGLLGLYRGVPRTVLGAGHAAIPSVITLFRGPLMRQYRDPAALVAGVEETLRHELAHHLGISDARLDELKRGER
jgi:predicted Zn-dependent protease with MMP-like domain